VELWFDGKSRESECGGEKRSVWAAFSCPLAKTVIPGTKAQPNPVDVKRSNNRSDSVPARIDRRIDAARPADSVCEMGWVK